MVYSMNSTKRKKKLRTVELRFFQDDANGEWGVTHKDTMEQRGTNGFNAFWDGRGLFHDVFEHAHEFTDKHFLGESAMNVGGEVAAMGQMWFFINSCGMSNRLLNSYRSPDDVTLESTFYMMQEAIESGNSSFGYTLESSAPSLPECDDSGLEWIIETHWERIQACQVAKDTHAEREYCQQYKDSVTLEKLQNLYRYGYEMGRKLFPSDGYRNGSLMSDFVEYWDAFCKRHDAETMARLYGKVEFTLYRDADNCLAWKAEFVPMYGIPSDEVSRVVIRGTQDGIKQIGELMDF